MHYDRITAASVDGMRDVTTHVLDLCLFIFVFIVQ